MGDPTSGFDRLRPASVDDAQLARFIELAREIEDCVIQGDGESEEPRLETLLAEWHASANRTFEPIEFKLYYGAVDTETFARSALLQSAPFIGDLRFEEARAAVAAILGVKLGEAETGAVMSALEANFPGAGFSDLIFWPSEWFRDEARRQAELTPAQLVGYASARSGRSVEGTPEDLDLPYAIPKPIQLSPPEG